jgi:protein-S-isoprenylcysteine O-methyltransferase Ste14
VVLRSMAIGSVLFAAGIGLALWGARTFAAHGATILPTERSSLGETYLTYKRRVRRWL